MRPNPHITLRAATEADIPRIARLKEIAFQVPADKGRRDLLDNPRWSYRAYTVAEKEGEVVACAGLLNTQLWLSGVPLSTGAIGGVVTHPDHRRQGIFSAMMQHLLAKMETQGTALAILYPATQSLYQPLGFANGGIQHAYKINPANLAVSPKAATGVRPFTADDLAMLRAIYRGSQLSLADGRLTRKNSWWDRLIARTAADPNRRLIVFEDDDGLSGYAFYQFTDTDTLHVNELVTTSNAAWRGLWAGLGQSAAHRPLTWLAPPDAPLQHLLRTPSDPDAANRGWVFNDIYQAVTSFHVRITNLTQALTSRFYPHNMMGNRLLHIDDPTLPGNNQPVKLRIVDGRPDTLPVDADETPHLRTDIATFSQILVGFLSPAVARQAGKLTADDDTIAWLQQAMAATPLFIQPGDWF